MKNVTGESGGDRRRPGRAVALLRWGAPLAVCVALLAAWEATVRLGEIPPYKLAAPSLIAKTVYAQWPQLAAAWAVTVKTMIVALVAAVATGVGLAAAFSMSRVLEASLLPYAVILQVTPLVAVAPFIVMWVGLDRVWLTQVVCAWIVAFFPILSNTAIGLRNVDGGLRDLFDLYGATGRQKLWWLLAPSALPYFLAGLKVSANLALVGAVVAEFVIGPEAERPGLASVILAGITRLDTPMMLAALGLVSLTGVATYFGVNLLSSWLLGGWHEERGEERRMRVQARVQGSGFRVQVGCAAVAAIHFIAAASASLAAEKVTLALNWLAQPELGGFYQALADGTYREHGLEVTIKPGGPMVNNRPLLAFERVEFLVGTNLLQPLDAAKQGIPTKAVAAFFQKDPQCILVHRGQGYDSWDDVKRAPLMMGNLARQSFFRWLNVAHGFGKANLRPYNHSLVPFLVDKKSAMQGYATAEPKRVEEATGEEPVVFLLADHGWTSYSTVLETRTKLIEEKPEMVQAFVDASILGWYRYLYGDRTAADALIMKENPAMTAGQIAYSVEKMQEWKLVDSGHAEKLGIGAMNQERIHRFYQDMVQVGMYQPGDVKPEEAVTVEFVNKGVGLELRPKAAR